MDGRLKQIKDKLYWFVAQKNEGVNNEFGPYVEENRAFHHEFRHERWLLLARLNWHYRVLKKTTPLLQQEKVVDITDEKYYEIKEERQSVDQLVQTLSAFDLISFDIFDTALFRKVEKPSDVFRIMALEMKQEDFVNIRKLGEEKARQEKDNYYFTREVTLAEIYHVLERDFGISSRWMEREIELEIELSEVNPFIFQVYQSVLEAGKAVVGGGVGWAGSVKDRYFVITYPSVPPKDALLQESPCSRTESWANRGMVRMTFALPFGAVRRFSEPFSVQTQAMTAGI